MEEKAALIRWIREEFSLQQQQSDSLEDCRKQLAAYINYLIHEDFGRLVHLLYRIDVSESRLRELLASGAETDAGDLIAGLILERQLQKLQSRNQFQQKGPISEDEKW
jgi:hypothetical protein